MKRAHETAQIIARRLNLDVTVREDLREINVGDLEGRDFSDENWSIYHAVTNQWYAGNPHASFPGGDDYVTAWERMRRTYLQVLQNHENDKLVIVGHGGIFIATLKELIPGLEIGWLQNAIYYNCAITELEVEILDDELQGRLVRWSDNHYLSGDALTTTAAIPPLSSIQDS
jgi:broad specificity phosphatase PhoE